jgi:hypothetical protein
MKTILTIIIAAVVGLVCGFLGGAICLVLYTMHRENKVQE